MKNYTCFLILGLLLILSSCNPSQNELNLTQKEIEEIIFKTRDQDWEIHELETDLKMINKVIETQRQRLSAIYWTHSEQIGKDPIVFDKKKNSYQKFEDLSSLKIELNKLKRELILNGKYLDFFEENLRESSNNN